MDLADSIMKACEIANLAQKKGIDPNSLIAYSNQEAIDFIENSSGGLGGINVPNPPINDITSRVAPSATNKSKLLYPEKRALQKREEEQQKKADFARDISNLKKSEIENLDVLIKKDGRIIIESKTLEAMALEGETIETENLERLGLVKRDLIEDSGAFGGNMIEFRITHKGREIHNLFKQNGVI